MVYKAEFRKKGRTVLIQIFSAKSNYEAHRFVRNTAVLVECDEYAIFMRSQRYVDYVEIYREGVL